MLYATAAAFVFAFLGATAVSLLPKQAVRPLILVLLIGWRSARGWRCAALVVGLVDL
ncbi:hypothetical protein NB693_25425 [Pantoea ananatis]|uniref:hypothetical protein n=1 Tax=Pantoea ananas TaxID=553 RepID=UPI00221E4705|nr:hypothetical protein [Pantoea ananatis]